MALHAPTTGDIVQASDVDQFVDLLTGGTAGQLLAATGSGGDPEYADPPLELTDGTTDLTGVTKITVAGGAVVGGTAGAATLTITRGINWTGPWDFSRAYVPGDGCMDHGFYWVCQIANTNSEPDFGEMNWTLLTTQDASSHTKIYEKFVDPSAATISVDLSPYQFYRTLEIDFTGAVDVATNSLGVNMQFNADAGSNYDYQITGSVEGTTADNLGALAQPAMVVGAFPGTSAPSGAMGVIRLRIVNFAATTFRKSVQGQYFNDYDDSTKKYQHNVGGTWRNTDAITLLDFYPDSGNFVRLSTLSIYGLL